MGQKYIFTTFWLEIFIWINHQEYLNIKARIILKWIIIMRMLTEFTQHRSRMVSIPSYIREDSGSISAQRPDIRSEVFRRFINSSEVMLG